METIFDRTLIRESLAGINLRYGAKIANSIVVCTFNADGRFATVGHSIRFDLDVCEAPEQMAEILEFHSRTANGALLVAIVDEERAHEIGELFARMAELWPLTYHGGNVMWCGSAMWASDAGGTRREEVDELELLATQTSQHYAGWAVAESPGDLGAPRDPDGDHHEMVSAVLGAAMMPRDYRAATAGIVRAVEDGSPCGVRELAGVLAALRASVRFRDGLISWAIGNRPAPSDLRSSCEDHSEERVAEPQRFERILALLKDTATIAPEGGAAAPLAAAAYLAWFSGNGLRARILAEQCAEEDPEYSLGRLVNRAVSMHVPPPWVREDGDRLVG